MGRGRAKAKQVKVARQLKYSSGGTDLDRLKNELAAAGSTTQQPSDEVDVDDTYPDEGGHGGEGRSAG